MKLHLDSGYLDELFELEEEGEVADAIVNAFFLNLEDADLQRIASSSNPKESYRKVILSKMDAEEKSAFARVQVGYGLDELTLLNEEDYRKDPYYQKVCAAMRKELQIGSWTLSMKSYRPYELFVYDEVRPTTVNPYSSYSPLGYFQSAFPYPALEKDERVYMSLIPHEMNTMKEAISKAHGKVLTMGLGMGYFAFMASNKEDVKSLTILERDIAVIKIFKEMFLPLFDHPEKIKIVQIEDALSYETEEPFDYCFMDLHHDAEDGLPLYISLLKKKGLANVVDVWIEKALLAYFRRYLIALIEEESDGYGEEAYNKTGEFADDLFYALHRHLKQTPLESEEELLKLLSDDSLKRIIAEMNF